MSIESNLKRIADALERIADNMSSGVVETPKQEAAPPAPVATSQSTAEVPAAPVETTAPAVPPPQQVEQPATAPAETVAPTMTVEQLNAELVKEFGRLNNDRSKIDSVLKKYCNGGVADLKPELYQTVLDEVRALS